MRLPRSRKGVEKKKGLANLPPVPPPPVHTQRSGENISAVSSSSPSSSLCIRTDLSSRTMRARKGDREGGADERDINRCG